MGNLSDQKTYTNENLLESGTQQFQQVRLQVSVD